MAQRVPERARWIEVLGHSLDEAEERRRMAVEVQLNKMVRGAATEDAGGVRGWYG